ncbi:hypothetical protein [Paenibacillus sp. N3.4]|uniref:hypothetical protein n=1 Tax=Paenibacillus sp. N3.4 TaxID=2603222 RepID=UPI0011C98399|nr:hypothetical protein [Paenibacillus sp. N3.4]TXK77713.1 hypothetical protein FU659_21775 [Paenibacillus sp. N3.4]
MNLDNWLAVVFDTSKYKIKAEITKVIMDHNERGVLLSSFAGTSCIKVGFNALTLEINEVFTKLSELKYFNMKDLKFVYLKVYDFIENQRNEIIEQTEITNYTPEINFIDRYLNECRAHLELRTEVYKQIIMERKRKFYWDFFKIIISAVIGGLIGGYISKYIFLK